MAEPGPRLWKTWGKPEWGIPSLWITLVDSFAPKAGKTDPRRAGGQRQRVDSTTPRMMAVKPIPRFQLCRSVMNGTSVPVLAVT